MTEIEQLKLALLETKAQAFDCLADRDTRIKQLGQQQEQLVDLLNGVCSELGLPVEEANQPGALIQAVKNVVERANNPKPTNAKRSKP